MSKLDKLRARHDRRLRKAHGITVPKVVGAMGGGLASGVARTVAGEGANLVVAGVAGVASFMFEDGTREALAQASLQMLGNAVTTVTERHAPTFVAKVQSFTKKELPAPAAAQQLPAPVDAVAAPAAPELVEVTAQEQAAIAAYLATLRRGTNGVGVQH